MLGAAACFAAGLLLGWAGWRALKALEPPPGTTSFVRVWSPRVWAALGAYLLLFAGLMLCFIFTPMCWLARRH